MASRFLLMFLVFALCRFAVPLQAQKVRSADRANDLQAAPLDRQPLTARAVLVKGRVYRAPVGATPTDGEAWTRVNQGDELSSGTQLRVSIRSTLLLQYGDDTVVQLKSMTLASLDELYRTETRKRGKLGLAYGAIRASVRAKELRSDLIIESPTVTCSKEGTEDFEIRTMRGSWWWSAAGPSAGTILVRDVGTGRSERLSFGQLVNFFTMTTPAVQRNLIQHLADLYGSRFLSSGEQDFNVFVDTGQSVTGPGIGVQAFATVPGLQQGMLPGGAPSLTGEAISRALELNAALLFRQVESRFGTGRLSSAGAARGRFAPRHLGRPR